MAVTLGDPRGIGPEVVQRALAQERLDADITLIGPDDQIAKIPADHRVSVGVGLWILGIVGLMPHGGRYAVAFGAWGIWGEVDVGNLTAVGFGVTRIW